ncbi:MAG: restriction endonuclease subunit S [Planctomycetaceae bacterium]
MVLREEKQRVGSFDADELPLLGVSNTVGLHQSGLPRIPDMSRYLRVELDWFAYNPMRINVGSIGWAKSVNQTGVISPDYVVFSCSSQILPYWVYCFLKHRRGLDAINDSTAGSVRERLYFDKLAKIEIPLPPLPEQRRVVARIEELSAQIHEARTLRHQATQEAELLFQTSLTAKLDSSKWPVRLLPEVASLARGKFDHRPRNEPRFFGGEYPFIQIGDLSKCTRHVRTHSQSLNADGLAISRMFPKGTVAIAITGATIGVTRILGFDSCFPDSIVGIQANPEDATPEFIYLAVEHAKKSALAEATQTTQPNINLGNLQRLQVRVPPLAEQRRIVAELDALQAEVDALKRLQAETSAELDALLPAILDRAFKGEL